jgi:cytochrome P450
MSRGACRHYLCSAMLCLFNAVRCLLLAVQLCSDTTPPTYPVLALGSGADDPRKWQSIRGGFSGAFDAEAVPQYVPILNEEVRQVVPSLALGI